jgi:hypothetical protein
MSLQDAYQIFDQVAEALADGHRQGVAHLSLQPENIILGPAGAVLINTNTAQLHKLAGPAGATNGGTEYYSPEQRAGAAGDAASDIYALGTILYEMLTGRHPGVGTFQTTSEIRPEADEAVDVLIARARAIDPTKRYRSVDEMRQETQRLWGRSRAGRPDHYLRRGLVLTSELYSRLVSWSGILALIALLLLYIGVFEAWSGLAALKGIARLAVLTLVGSLAASVVGYYIIRETARVRGLGSLVPAGRGMGAIFGALIALWWFRITDWGQSTSLQALDVGDFIGYGFIVLMISVIFTVLFIELMRGIAGQVDRRWHRYRTVFYTSYLLLCVVILLLALLRLPQGISFF